MYDKGQQILEPIKVIWWNNKNKLTNSFFCSLFCDIKGRSHTLMMTTTDNNLMLPNFWYYWLFYAFFVYIITVELLYIYNLNKKKEFKCRINPFSIHSFHIKYSKITIIKQYHLIWQFTLFSSSPIQMTNLIIIVLL